MRAFRCARLCSSRAPRRESTIPVRNKSGARPGGPCSAARAANSSGTIRSGTSTVRRSFRTRTPGKKRSAAWARATLRAWAASRRPSLAPTSPRSGKPAVPSESGSGLTQVTAARTRDRRFALIYIPSDGRKPRELIVNFDEFSAPVTARWFNPARDTELLAHDAAPSNRGSQKLQTPGDNGTGVNDWVLVLEAR